MANTSSSCTSSNVCPKLIKRQNLLNTAIMGPRKNIRAGAGYCTMGSLGKPEAHPTWRYASSDSYAMSA